MKYQPNEKVQLRAKQLTSIFENSTPELQYGYAEALDDKNKRGITFGFAGFVSCMDGAQVLGMLPHEHKLSKYYEDMKKACNGDMSCKKYTRKLLKTKFIEDVQSCEDDFYFKGSQEATYFQLYFQPSIEIMTRMNLSSDFTFICLNDAMIQHGLEDDDGVKEIMSRVGIRNGEKAWLKQFLIERKEMLENSDETWQESVPRVTELQRLFESCFGALPEILVVDSPEYGRFEL